ncbi:alpha/beta hydrolase family protein, partial [Brachybacterium vulturis]|uniref:alpha/beta hydrolase family protein n=1 Tax=Brachybacterium vulturis TaxID=2017484 RepID=UPI003736487F
MPRVDGLGLRLGLGGSEGERGDGSFTVTVDDTVRAAEFLAERGAPPTRLIGHSWGGAAAIVAAQRILSGKAVVSIGAPAEPAEVERHDDSVADRVMEEGTATWLVGGREKTRRRDVVQDVGDAELIARARTLERPLLVMHSPTDATVSIDTAREIFRAAAHFAASSPSRLRAGRLALSSPGRDQCIVDNHYLGRKERSRGPRWGFPHGNAQLPTITAITVIHNRRDLCRVSGCLDRIGGVGRAE